MQNKKIDTKTMLATNISSKSHRKNKKRRKYLILLFIVLVILGFVAYTLHKFVTYQTMVELARLQTNLDHRIEKCKQAILYCPDKTEAYRLMLESMLLDEVFTEEEERMFLSSIKKPIALEKAKGFSELAFETGKAYLYYYTYGCTTEESKDELHSENLIVRMQSCHNWFNKAATASKGKNYKEVVALRDISAFYIENTKRIAEGTDTRKIYRTCWNDIKNLMYLTPKATKVEAFRIYEIVLDTVLTYRTSLLESGVDAEDIQQAIADVESSIQEMEVHTKREKSWKKWLLKKQDHLYKKID